MIATAAVVKGTPPVVDTILPCLFILAGSPGRRRGRLDETARHDTRGDEEEGGHDEAGPIARGQKKPPGEPPHEDPQKLGTRIETHAAAATLGRKTTREDGRKDGLKKGEGGKISDARGRKSDPTRKEGQDEKGHSGNEKRRAEDALGLPPPLKSGNEWSHDKEGHKEDGNIETPGGRGREPPAVDEECRKKNEDERKGGVLGKDPVIRAPQSGSGQKSAQGRDQRHDPPRKRLRGHAGDKSDKGDEGEDRRQREDCGHPEPAGDERTEKERKNKGATDRGTDDRHGLDPLILMNPVADRGERHRTDGSRTLERATDKKLHDAVRKGGDDAPDDEENETEGKNPAPPPAIGKGPQGDLQKALGESVDPKTRTGQKGIRPGKGAGVRHEKGVDHEESEHAGGHDGTRPECGREFRASHHSRRTSCPRREGNKARRRPLDGGRSGARRPSSQAGNSSA